ncbi:MAG: hypothetical protein SVZ03_04025 [Spirochaetota bacterium]|nr:hypothetical protein [Spirochaetota bacterium]
MSDKKGEIILKYSSISATIFFAILLFAALSLQGCLRVHTHVKGLEPQAHEIGSKNFEVLGPVEGQSSSFNLLWIFPVTPIANFNEAIDDAITEKGGNNLIDVHCWHERQIWIVGSIDILHVKGKVIRYKE